MLSTVDLKLTDCMNTDLIWKTVKRGNRSMTRRSRKPANLGADLGGKSLKRVEDSSVCESEKLGVAVLGQRFAEVAAHVPIKKRRLLLRSPSPPPRTTSPDREESLSPQPQAPSSPDREESLSPQPQAPSSPDREESLSPQPQAPSPPDREEPLSSQPQAPSPHPEESEHLVDRKCASGQQYCPDSFPDQQTWAFDGSIAVKSGHDVDGVMNGKISEVTNGELGYSDDFSGFALCAAAAACSSGIDNDAGNVKETSVVEEFTTPEVIDSSTAAIPLPETIAPLGTGNFLQKDLVREENMEGSFVQDKFVTVLHNLHDFKNGGTVKRSFPSKDDRLHWDLNTVMDAWIEPCDDPLLDSQRNDSEYVLVDGMQSEKLNSEACEIQTDLENIQLGNISLESVRAGKHDVSSLDIPLPDDAGCAIDGSQSTDGEDSGKKSGLPNNRTSPGKVMSTVTCKTLDAANSVSNSDKVDPFHPSPECEDLSSSSTAIGERQPVIDGGQTGLDDKFPTADFPVHIKPKELMPKGYGDLVSNEGAQGRLTSQGSCKTYGDDPTSCTGKLVSEDPICDSHVSDVYQGERSHMVGVANMTKVQAGYDSPFEDGELRELVVYSREGNDVEEVETECLDSESDNGDRDDFDAAYYSLSEEIEVGREGYQTLEKGSLLAKEDDSEKIGMIGKRALDAGSVNSVEQCVKGDALKEPNLSVSPKTQTSGRNQLPEHNVDVIAERNDGSTRKTSHDNRDGLDDKVLLTGEVGSKSSMGKLSSRVEGPLSFDVLHRKDTELVQRSRSDNLGDSYSRGMGDFRSDKSMGRDRCYFQVRGRNEADGYWVDSSASYLDSRNRYTPSHRGPEGHGYSRRAIANSTAKVGGLNSHDHRQPINYSSKGMYRPHVRRSSPVDRDDAYSVRRVKPVRGIGYERSRGRSGMYQQGVRRVPKEEFDEPVLDAAAESAGLMPRYSARRERGFSPNFRRGAQFSRTRSPLAWHLHRERNVGTRRHSPDFRSEARMEGMRLPFQKPSFAADYEESFMSPPRGRLSPERNSRWFDDQDCTVGHFKDRRSPVRMFRRSQRFGAMGHPGRLKSDDYSRPLVHRVRFPQMAGAGRGRNEDSDDDKRKHDDRHEMVHQVRRHDAGGVVRRFRYDTEDCFEARNSHNEDEGFRGTVRRDLPRSAREKRGPSRYNSDRMYSDASSSGLQDYDEYASPRGG